MYISVSLVGNKEIRALNKKYLDRDCATDVLSFNYLADDVGESEGDFLGDIVVSTDMAKKQASSYGNTYEEEVSELVAHGVLHLLGVHHACDNAVSTHGVQRVSKGTKK
jgi:probable rRNA maturation factor